MNTSLFFLFVLGEDKYRERGIYIYIYIYYLSPGSFTLGSWDAKPNENISFLHVSSQFGGFGSNI